MGKNEEALPLSSSTNGENSEVDLGCYRQIWRYLGFKCVVVLLLSFAVILSAIIWLPPFSRSGVRGNAYRDSHLEAPILASFKLQRPSSLLRANLQKLEYDIFEEIGIPNSMVAITSLQIVDGSNWTNVVFGVWPYPRHVNISSTGLSLLRSSFVSLVLRQSNLHLTSSLFGDSSFFQVLKFPGGITISPPQNVFLLQRGQILFNFTLNFSIYQIEDNFNDLKAQLSSGLHLTPYENLYMSLKNMQGSTLDPPSTVQTSVLLAVGNRPPSLPRLKQLIQTIRNSTGKNLGLNHTVFGKVKQIRLSSYLVHTLNNTRNSSTSGYLGPSQFPPHHRHHHHHHHNHNYSHHHHHRHHHHSHHRHHHHSHHHHHNNSYHHSHRHYNHSHSHHHHHRYSNHYHNDHYHQHPNSTVAPMPSLGHSISPNAHARSPAPSPYSFPISPLPSVIFVRAQPPNVSKQNSNHPGGTALILPPSSSSPITSSAAIPLPSFHPLVILLLLLSL